MRKNISIFVVCAIFTIVAVGCQTGSDSGTSVSREAFNQQLDGVAEDVAELLSSAELREQLQNRIKRSSNREQIVLLDSFLRNVGKEQEQNTQKLLAEVTQLRRSLDTLQEHEQPEDERLKGRSVELASRFDLYFPVKEHRQEWSGEDELIVSSVPLGLNQEETEAINGYRLSGKQTSLPLDEAPDMPVLVIAPEEHVSHEAVPSKGVDKPPAEQKEKVPEPGDDHSSLGIPLVKMLDDYEGWFHGEPELQITVAGNVWNIEEVKDENVWYFLGDHGPTYWYWEENDDPEYFISFIELDGGALWHDLIGGETFNRNTLDWQGFSHKRYKKIDYKLDKDARNP